MKISTFIDKCPIKLSLTAGICLAFGNSNDIARAGSQVVAFESIQMPSQSRLFVQSFIGRAEEEKRPKLKILHIE